MPVKFIGRNWDLSEMSGRIKTDLEPDGRVYPCEVRPGYHRE